jgi:GNAT superfamily N-acetyltransferase
MNTSTTQLRRATAEDIPALVAMGARMHAESPRLSKTPYQPQRIQHVLSCLMPTQECFMLIAERDGKPAGMLGGIVTDHLLSGVRYAGDLAVYVAPEYRGTSILPRMLREFERWAVENDATEITLGVTTEIHPERTAALYERNGYRLSGSIAVKDI